MLHNLKLILILTLSYGFMTAEASMLDSLRLEQRQGKSFIIHQVDQGETLYSLSRRYGSSVDQIAQSNQLVNYAISVGQELNIPYKEVKITGMIHTVDAGETLYSISRAYNVKVDDIIAWNNLQGNAISVGQKLSIGTAIKSYNEVTTNSEVQIVESVEEDEVSESQQAPNKEPSIEKAEPKKTIKKQSTVYMVQTGETMTSIANKFQVSEDSIKVWNNLRNNRVSIGQKLIFPYKINMDSLALAEKKPGYKDTKYGSKYSSSVDGGVKKLYEEGIAKVIDSQINSTKYLALHRTLTVGTVFQVKNLMNNKSIYVRVVGKLPDTGINDNVMIRLTPIAFEKLGIIDEKALVGITYFDE